MDAARGFYAPAPAPAPAWREVNQERDVLAGIGFLLLAFATGNILCGPKEPSFGLFMAYVLLLLGMIFVLISAIVAVATRRAAEAALAVHHFLFGDPVHGGGRGACGGDVYGRLGDRTSSPARPPPVAKEPLNPRPDAASRPPPPPSSGRNPSPPEASADPATSSVLSTGDPPLPSQD